MSAKPLLHIHHQTGQGDAAFIIGNRKALQALIKAIEKAMADDKSSDIEVSAADGIAYNVIVTCWDVEDWSKNALPYTEDDVVDKRENALWPWDIVINEIPNSPVLDEICTPESDRKSPDQAGDPSPVQE